MKITYDQDYSGSTSERRRSSSSQNAIPAHRHLYIKPLELFSFNSFHICIIAPLVDVAD